MTRVRAWFTIRTEEDETVTVDAKPDDIDNGLVHDALRVLYPFEDISIDDYEVVDDE